MRLGNNWEELKNMSEKAKNYLALVTITLVWAIILGFSGAIFFVKCEKKEINMSINSIKVTKIVVFFRAIDRDSYFGIMNLLKSPVLTLWAWRGFIF